MAPQEGVRMILGTTKEEGIVTAWVTREGA